ncbi:MAG TPA: hypothetical protein VER33_28230 [Polyangiaceae bacterium]|nr:hypothetical protein [Polyangiaceae bacterium]
MSGGKDVSAAPTRAEPPRATSNGLALLWSLAAVPCTGLAFAATGLVLALADPGGFAGVTFGPFKDSVLGAISGLVWGLALLLPHALLLRSYIAASERFRALESSAAGGALALFVCALPQAALLALLLAPRFGMVAWPGVTFGLWLPRVLVARLRRGNFAASGRAF